MFQFSLFVYIINWSLPNSIRVNVIVNPLMRYRLRLIPSVTLYVIFHHNLVFGVQINGFNWTGMACGFSCLYAVKTLPWSVGQKQKLCQRN